MQKEDGVLLRPQISTGSRKQLWLAPSRPAHGLELAMLQSFRSLSEGNRDEQSFQNKQPGCWVFSWSNWANVWEESWIFQINKQTPGNSPAAAMAARVGRHGSKRIKVYQMLMRPHRWFLGSFLNLALQELGFFPSSRCSEMPQRRCDFGGKLAANPQRPLGSLLCTYLHAEGLPWLQPRWKKCIPTKQLCSSSLKPF